MILAWMDYKYESRDQQDKKFLSHNINTIQINVGQPDDSLPPKSKGLSYSVDKLLIIEPLAPPTQSVRPNPKISSTWVLLHLNFNSLGAAPRFLRLAKLHRMFSLVVVVEIGARSRLVRAVPAIDEDAQMIALHVNTQAGLRLEDPLAGLAREVAPLVRPPHVLCQRNGRHLLPADAARLQLIGGRVLAVHV